MQTVYLLKDPRNDEPRYVGVTSNLKKRIRNHLSRINRRSHCASWINLLKDISMEPVVEILETVEDEDREISEIAWILGFRIAGYDLTNLTMGGEGIVCPSTEIREQRRARMLGNKYALGFFPSSETREKLTAARLGHVVTPETREKLRLVNIGNKNGLRHVVSPETRDKIRRSRMGRVASSETRERLRIAHLGHTPSPEARENNRLAQLGRKHTLETKKKMSASQRGHIVTSETREKISKRHLGCVATPVVREKMSVSQKARWAKRKEIIQ
jgi:hypothetical protein